MHALSEPACSHSAGCPGRARAAEDAFRDALALFQFAVCSAHAAHGLPPLQPASATQQHPHAPAASATLTATAAAAPPSADSTAWLGSPALDPSTACQVAQALAGLSRVLLGALRAVQNAAQAQADQALLQRLRAFRLRASDARLLGTGAAEAPAGPEGVTCMGVLVCRPGSLPAAAAARQAPQAVPMLRAALKLMAGAAAGSGGGADGASRWHTLQVRQPSRVCFPLVPPTGHNGAR